jgi:hypothetical protein
MGDLRKTLWIVDLPCTSIRPLWGSSTRLRLGNVQRMCNGEGRPRHNVQKRTSGGSFFQLRQTTHEAHRARQTRVSLLIAAPLEGASDPSQPIP